MDDTTVAARLWRRLRRRPRFATGGIIPPGIQLVLPPPAIIAPPRHLTIMCDSETDPCVLADMICREIQRRHRHG